MQITDDATWGQVWGVPKDHALAVRERLKEVLRVSFDARAKGHRVPITGRLYLPPGALGMWLLERMEAPMDPIPTEYQRLIANTTPQHRIELFQPSDPISAIHHYDGRAMYLGCCAGIGAPGTMLRHYEGSDIIASERGRASIEFTVPADWKHVGLLPVKGMLTCTSWTWPMSGVWETWADLSEIRLAKKYGWKIRVLEKLVWSESRPLDRWSERLSRCYLDCKRRGEDLVAWCVRSIALHTIGRFHNLGYGDETEVVPITDPRVNISNTVAVSGQMATLRKRVPIAKKAYHCHPEWSAAIWSRARLRVVKALLDCDPSTILGVRGDGIWLSYPPPATTQVHAAWRDTGDCGQFRHKWSQQGEWSFVSWEMLSGQEA